MQEKLTPANLAFGIGALVTLLGSFLKFTGSGNFGFNAWSTDGLAFASTVPALLALAALVWIGLELGGVSLPDDVLTFNPQQLKATWGISAGGLMIAWLTANPDTAAGFWLMLLGSLAMAVGSVLELLGVATDPLTSSSSGAAAASPAAPTATDQRPAAGGTPPPPPVPPQQDGGTPPPPPSN